MKLLKWRKEFVDAPDNVIARCAVGTGKITAGFECIKRFVKERIKEGKKETTIRIYTQNTCDFYIKQIQEEFLPHKVIFEVISLNRDLKGRHKDFLHWISYLHDEGND